MNRAFNLVKRFHQAFGHPVGLIPSMLDPERLKVRIQWIKSEVEELESATTLVDQVDALGDIAYFVIGTFVEMAVMPGAIFKAINDANMAKLFPDGRPRYREEDGKIMKPPGWVGPEQRISAEIEKAERGEGERKYSHYFKETPFDRIDIYRTLSLFNVIDPCLQHAIKKLLVAGGRSGGKDIKRDIQEAIDALLRWQEMKAEEAEAEQ